MVNVSNWTGTYLICDYGDSSAIYGPVPMTSQFANLNHTYSKSGQFTLNLTVYNEAETQSKILPVSS